MEIICYSAYSPLLGSKRFTIRRYFVGQERVIGCSYAKHTPGSPLPGRLSGFWTLDIFTCYHTCEIRQVPIPISHPVTLY